MVREQEPGLSGDSKVTGGVKAGMYPEKMARIRHAGNQCTSFGGPRPHRSNGLIARLGEAYKDGSVEQGPFLTKEALDHIFDNWKFEP